MFLFGFQTIISVRKQNVYKAQMGQNIWFADRTFGFRTECSVFGHICSVWALNRTFDFQTDLPCSLRPDHLKLERAKIQTAKVCFLSFCRFPVFGRSVFSISLYLHQFSPFPSIPGRISRNLDQRKWC